MTLERIQPDGLAKLPLFTQVVKAGNTVYIAGQPALDSRGQLVGPGDITAQATQVFDNIGIALKSVGASFDNLVKMTIFATDRAHLAPIAEVRAKYLGHPDPVTSTFVEVAGLAWPEMLLEIESVAVLD
jgi:enamine deaminase RidA (YjgF/YER057c/UK114 family)